jgi:tetratricopeptide (TPR) repeat protein
MLRSILCLLLAALPAQCEWILLKTPQLELLTDAGEKSATRLLDRMSTVRQVLGEGARAERPLRVFLFASEREFHSYAEGTVTEGFFQSGPERDYIVLPAGSGFTRTVAHEYVHRILSHNASRFPRWLYEGLAEFYSTLEVKGTTAVVGSPIEPHLFTLAKTPWLTAEQMEPATAASSHLNERELAGVFYAESWALVHLLKLAPKWREQTPRFLEELAAGRDAQQAFHDAYGRTVTFDDAIRDLHGYLTHLRTARVEIPARVPDDAPSLAKLDTLGSTLQRADLALHVAKYDLARKLFEEAARVHPDSPQAEAGLGTLAMAQNRRAEALSHLRRGSELRAPGGEIYFELAMLRRDEGASSQEVDQLLERAIAADPSYAEAQLVLGQRQTDRGDYTPAIEHLEKAANILPGQSDIWHALAYAQVKAGLKDAARDSARRALRTARSMEHERMAQVLLESLE